MRMTAASHSSQGLKSPEKLGVFWRRLLKMANQMERSTGRFDPLSVANLVISMLEGATVVARINKRSAALADAQRHLSLYLETAVRLRS